MLNFGQFKPNQKETFVCNECGHCYDRHVMSVALRGCLVNSCRCRGNGSFVRPVPPQITEYVTDLKTNQRVVVNQPAPPTHLGIV